MEKNNPIKKSFVLTPSKDIRNSSDPDIAGSYAMQRAGQAAIDLAIQTNTAIVTTVDGKIVRISAAELIKQRQLTA
ncbi:hypothetical protein [Polynucleobacter sp. Adler-ghost]|uniref:hypothetical protein n=1 Tax=Polynucleobacter sp. Adler-ghost TaxID=2770234 RepID=UPI00203FDA0B|nr:hypothetical protein [Polynucleobacter sp. Adler-ghost]